MGLKRFNLMLQNMGTLIHCALWLYILQIFLLPLNLFVCTATYILGIITTRLGITSDRYAKTSNPRLTVLIDGGRLSKGLFLARLCKQAQYRVIYTSTASTAWAGARFSRAIDKFYLVPRSHEDYENCRRITIGIVQQENVDLYMPVSTASSAVTDCKLARELEQYGCGSVALDPDHSRRLDDKGTFSEWARELGCAVPQTMPVTDPEQVVQILKTALKRKSAADDAFLLKSIQYDDAHRNDVFSTRDLQINLTATLDRIRALPISLNRPWILQEYIRGSEFCTHALVRYGTVLALAICPSSPWLLQYKHVKQPSVRKWVENFCAKANLSGHVCFDFIVRDDDGEAYCIECNPRVSTALGCFRNDIRYGHSLATFATPATAAAGTSDKQAKNDSAIGTRPNHRTRSQYWLYHELYSLLQSRSTSAFLNQLRYIAQGEDALYEFQDPWPVFAQYHLLIPQQLVWHIRHLRPWSHIDYNLGRLID